MGISLGVHGRMRAVRITPVRGPALLVLTGLLFIAAVGCDTQRGERKSAGMQRRSDPKATAAAGAKRAPRGDETGAARQEARPAGATYRVRLTQKGCVQLEPHWTNIRVGQSLAWHSDFKSPVTVHVSPGAFDRTRYIVRAGASVSTGPARKPGSYSIWTEPAACQGIPLGVHGSGPGVTVEGAAQR